MKDNIMQYAAGEALNIWEAAKDPLNNFLKETSKKPNPKLIKENKYAGNSKYLEIGYIEAKLDQVYHGLWSWEIKHAEQIINGVMIYGDLKVFHPVAQVWIVRSGIGFKEFQLSKGETERTPQNLSEKALERDVPIAAAEAFKNASKKIGNTFGRHLNREFKYGHAEDKEFINRIYNTNNTNKNETD